MVYKPTPVPSDAQGSLARYVGEEFRRVALGFAQTFAGQRAGLATIGAGGSSVGVTFRTPIQDVQYAVALTAEGGELVWLTGKGAGGFTITRAGTGAALDVNWTVTRYRDN